MVPWAAMTERRLIPVTPEQPIACTLTPGEAVHRLGEWRSLIGEAAGPPQRTDRGARVHFPHTPDLERRVRALAAAETACCSFFEFDVRADGGDLTLDIEAPDDAQPLVEELVGGLS